MTATEEIAGGLDTAVDDLDQAATQAAAAADHADDVRNRAFAHGWEGIAAGMQAVIDCLEHVRASTERAKGSLDEAAGSVKEINSGTSPTEVRQQLTVATEKINESDAAVDDALSGVDEAEATALRALDGGDPGQLLGLIGDVGQLLVSARQHAQAARSKAEAETQEAAQAGN